MQHDLMQRSAINNLIWKKRGEERRSIFPVLSGKKRHSHISKSKPAKNSLSRQVLTLWWNINFFNLFWFPLSILQLAVQCYSHHVKTHPVSEKLHKDFPSHFFLPAVNQQRVINRNPKKKKFQPSTTMLNLKIHPDCKLILTSIQLWHENIVHHIYKFSNVNFPIHNLAS